MQLQSVSPVAFEVRGETKRINDIGNNQLQKTMEENNNPLSAAGVVIRNRSWTQTKADNKRGNKSCYELFLWSLIP